MPGRPAAPVLRPRVDPKICQCDMMAGDVFVTAYYGRPFALHVACPVCGYRDLVHLVMGEEQQMERSPDGGISRLLPGWKCGSPHCGMRIRIVGSRFASG